MFPVRHEHQLHLESNAISVTDRGGVLVFPVRYERHLHTASKDISVTDRTGLWGGGEYARPLEVVAVAATIILKQMSEAG
jgi:hypothetical protein